MLSCRALPVVALLTVLLGGCTQRTNPEPVLVAQLAPLSGPDKTVGDRASQGVLLAVEDANASEKKISGRPVAVLRVDSRDDDETVRAETVRLLTVNRVAGLLGSLDASLAERLVREAQGYGVPVLLSGELPGTTRAENVFCLSVSPVQRGQALARQVRELKIGKVAVLSDSRHEIAGVLAGAFARECRQDRMLQLKEWSYDGDSDRIDWFDDVVQLQPGAILVAGSAREFVKLARRLNKAKVKASLWFGGEDAGTTGLERNLDEAEVYLATVFAVQGLTDKGKEFAKRYEEKYLEPPDFAAAQAYDCARLLFETMRDLGSANATRVREQLAKTEKWESLTGPLTLQERRTKRPIFVLQLKGRETKLVKTIPADKE
jgi:ABC-type branched-subunit amino acid transport system substrate-binding protein